MNVMTKRFLSIAFVAFFSVALLTPGAYALSAVSAAAPQQQMSYAAHRRPVSYSPAFYQRRERRTSKTRTALRIAAPAAIGAGIGAMAGGKKGAGVGALLGGGSGAIYHLIKSRR
jgi:hypothetical protein